MTEGRARSIRGEPRFRGIKAFDRHLPISSPLPLNEELASVLQDLETGSQRDGIEGCVRSLADLEREVSAYIGVRHAAALSSGTAAVHMAVKLAAERLYGSASGISTPEGLGQGGALYGKRVFCADFAPASLAFPILYEGGEPIFIDASPDDWGMDPEVLEIAFRMYPDVRLVLMHHPYGFPAQAGRIKEICKAHGALLIEDVSEGLGARIDGKPVGAFGDYSVISFGGDQGIAGIHGGLLLCNDAYACKKARHWASMAYASVPWGQHEELGYDYGMDGITAAILLARFRHLDEDIKKRRRVYERYRKAFDEDLITMNPFAEDAEPSYQASCILLESGIRFKELRSERDYIYETLHGTASPMEIYDALQSFNAESRPLYKPLHMQPIFKNHEQITLDGGRRTYGDFYDDAFWTRCNVAKYNFETGLCLPSDIHMTEEEQDRVIGIVHACFD